MNLEDRREMREFMEKNKIVAQKKYGQNFLTDEGVLDEIIEGSGVTKSDAVLEIGPGLGTLTRRLSEAAQSVTAVEIDAGLIPVLEHTLEGYDNVSVINGDILKTDIRDLYDRYGNGKRMSVVANLPYYITTPIILRLLEFGDIIGSITVMVQKEVAVRMQAGPGSKDYGALSLAVQYFSHPEIVAQAPAECFFPMPGVDSVVIRLSAYEKPPVEVSDEELFFKLIRATFNLRRKTLPNAVAAGGLGLSRAQMEEILEGMGLPLTVRGETFTLEDFADLSNRVFEYKTHKM